MKKKSIMICSIVIIVLLIIGVVVVLVGKGDDKNQLDNTESEMIESTEVVNFPSTETEMSTEVETEVVEETKVETTNTNKNSNSGSVVDTNKTGSTPSAPAPVVNENEGYSSKELTAVNSGYYNVTIDSATGQYVVLVKNAEEAILGYDLINAYLEPMGFEIVPESCRGHWISIDNNQYIASCGEIREITRMEVIEEGPTGEIDEDDIIEFD